jgi:hypothetical protein
VAALPSKGSFMLHPFFFVSLIVYLPVLLLFTWLVCFFSDSFLNQSEVSMLLLASHLVPEVNYAACHQAVVIFSSRFLACDSHFLFKAYECHVLHLYQF